jgi:hypothetical protein
MYKSEISNAKWIIYDILGNIGWISFLVALSLCFIKMPEIFEEKRIVMLLMLDLLSAVLMLRGILELIGERVEKLDRVLSGKQLARGFGALTVGGALGMLCSLAALAITLSNGMCGAGYLFILSGGGLLCGAFSGLILKEYRKI